MKILITGAKGQLGLHLTSALKNTTFQVSALSHKELDICDLDSVKGAIQEFQPNIILNTAAYTNVETAELNSQDAFKVNCLGVRNLAEIAHQQNRILFHFSTDYIFSGKAENSYVEADSPEPLNAYGKSKLAGEEALKQSLSKYICIRSSWLFSEYGNNFVRKILQLAKSKQNLSVVDDEIGAPTYAGDLAEAVVDLIQCYAETVTLEWGEYHLCGAPSLSRYKFAEAILTEASKLNFLKNSVDLEPVSSSLLGASLMVQRPKKVVLNCRKIEKTFGLKQPDWKVGLLKTLKQLHQPDL